MCKGRVCVCWVREVRYERQRRSSQGGEWREEEGGGRVRESSVGQCGGRQWKRARAGVRVAPAGVRRGKRGGVGCKNCTLTATDMAMLASTPKYLFSPTRGPSAAATRPLAVHRWTLMAQNSNKQIPHVSETRVECVLLAITLLLHTTHASSPVCEMLTFAFW